MRKGYNDYVIEYGGKEWHFEHDNHAIEFIKALWRASGSVGVYAYKVAPEDQRDPEADIPGFEGTAEAIESLFDGTPL